MAIDQTAAERSCGHRKESSDESTQARRGSFCMSDSENISLDSGGTSYILYSIYHQVINLNFKNCIDRVLNKLSSSVASRQNFFFFKKSAQMHFDIQTQNAISMNKRSPHET